MGFFAEAGPVNVFVSNHVSGLPRPLVATEWYMTHGPNTGCHAVTAC